MNPIGHAAGSGRRTARSETPATSNSLRFSDTGAFRLAGGLETRVH